MSQMDIDDVESVETEKAPLSIYHSILQNGEAVYDAQVFTVTGELHYLAVNKGDRIEVYSASTSGLSLVTAKPIFGFAVAMAVDHYQPGLLEDNQDDRLLVLTRKNRMLVMKFESNELAIVNQIDLSEGVVRPPRKPSLIVSKDLVIVHITQGLLKLVNINRANKTLKCKPLRIEDLSIQDMAVNNDHILVLSKRANSQMVVRHYELPDWSSKTNFNLANKHPDLEVDVPEAYKVVPCGVGDAPSYLILTLDHVLFHDPVKGLKIGTTLGSVAFDAITIVEQMRFVAVDTDGMLYNIQVAEDKVLVDRLGRVPFMSNSTSIAYIGSALLYIGSKGSDSHLLKLLNEKQFQENPYFEIVQSFPSLGPVNSCVMSEDGKQLYACVGLNRGGALVNMRRGVGVNITGRSIGFPHQPTAISMFSYKGKRYVRMKLIEESYIFGLDRLINEGILEESIDRFIPSGEPLLLTENINTATDKQLLLIVVTSRRVSLYSAQGERKSVGFPSPPCIMAVLCDDRIACVMASSPNQIHVLKVVSGDILPFCLVQLDDINKQISAINMVGDFMAVAFWNDPNVVILRLGANGYEQVCVWRITAGEKPRSVCSLLFMLINEHEMALLASSICGQVYLTVFNPLCRNEELTTRQVSNGCRTPVQLFKHSSNTVFCTGDQPFYCSLSDPTGSCLLVNTLPCDLSDIYAYCSLQEADRVLMSRMKEILLVDASNVNSTKRHIQMSKLAAITTPFGPTLNQVLRHEHPVAICEHKDYLLVCTVDSFPSHLDNKAYLRQGRVLLIGKNSFKGTLLCLC